MDVIEQYRDDVIAYGYFTTANCKTAQLIANSTFNYHKNPPTIYDKFVLKVAKIKNSPILLALKKLGPCYTSKNTEIGKSECMLFFPSGYKNSSETGESTPIPTDEKPKKKKKKRKTKQGSDEENDNENNQVQNVAQAPADVEPEDCTEQDDDDSAEDEDSAEGHEMENLPETSDK
ncbi:uncharacterized protein LOC116347678 [Contarinia nasturtii]|uniref:uncharacterized protein LOC116347678 n=1 Tax=Contarinia nasturtii TaxID=265458 RepID=UPI0012D45E7A|nr:uncharacterized protein LOC116347678 [Contarinia nasturtii]